MIRLMKLNNFYVTIEVAPRDGYYESLQCYTDRNDTSKLKFTFPYGEITPEQAAAVAEFTKTLTDAYNVLQGQIKTTNKKLQLEEFTPITSPQVKTAGSDFDLDAKSAVPQSCALGDGEVSTGVDGEIKDAPFEEVETGSDKA